MMRLLRLVIVLAVPLSALATFGCGSDDPVDPGVPLVFGIRNGTWATIDSSSFSGPDTCLNRPDEVFVADTVLCDLEPVVDIGPFELRCDIVQDGNDVTYDCSLVANLDPCVLTLEIVGGGTVTDTTYDVTSTVFQTVSGPEIPCDIIYTADPCTAVVRSVGTWISAEGDSICPEDPSAASIPVDRLIARIAGGARHP